MKIYTVKIGKKPTKSGVIMDILKKYPDAKTPDIFATLYKLGLQMPFSSFPNTVSRCRKELKILKALGVK